MPLLKAYAGFSGGFCDREMDSRKSANTSRGFSVFAANANYCYEAMMPLPNAPNDFCHGKHSNRMEIV